MSTFYFQMKGDAEAFAIEAKAKAESEQMTKKAEAWKEYEEAAKVEMLLDVLPKVSRQRCAIAEQNESWWSSTVVA